MTSPPNSTAHLKLTPRGDIAFLGLDTVGKSVNVLSKEVLTEFQCYLEEIRNSSFKALVLISRKKNIFIAGADIGEIQKIKDESECEALLKEGHKILNTVEDFPLPIIAAIHGACLGGGLELSLACDYRLCTSEQVTRLGLPEVKLGIIPGFGGCVRMPRVIGFRSSLDLILTGKSVSGEKALKLGLVDACVPQKDLEERAFKWAQDLLKKEKKEGHPLKRKKHFQPKGFLNVFLESFFGRLLVFRQAKKMLLEKTKSFYPAPLKALNVIYQTYKDSKRDRSLKKESKAFVKVAMTQVSQNLISLFYLIEGAKKKFPSSKDHSFKVQDKVKQVGILGAGTMGGGIAYVMANKGFVAEIKDINHQALGLAMKTAYGLWKKNFKRKRISSWEFEKKMSFIGGRLNYEGLKDADVIIEAVVEDMNIKKQVIQECAKKSPPHAIMATNTSSLSVTEMAKAHPYPENFVGMHFFNPVDKMPLVEIIRGEKSSEEAVATVFHLAQKIGKTPIVVKDSFGFLVNRLLIPYMAEALFLLEEGMEIQSLDHHYTDLFGMPMGPLRLLDEVGLDVALKILNIFKSLSKGRITAPSLAEKMMSSNRLGKKNKKGFYLYDSKGKCLSVDKEVYKDLDLKPPRKQALSAQECLERGLFLMINEAAMALEEKVVDSPQELDLAMIFGIGFPPFRGGLLKYADQMGVETIAQSLNAYLKSYKRPVFSPSTALKKRVKEKKLFF